MLRLVIHRILLLLAVPIVFVGLIDPLEGGIALILAGFVYLVAFLVGGRKPTKFLWISYLSAVVIGAIVLVFAIFGMDRVSDRPEMIPLAIGNWIYRVAVLFTLAAALNAAILSFRKRESK